MMNKAFLKKARPAIFLGSILASFLLLYFKVVLPQYEEYVRASYAYVIDCTIYDSKMTVLKDVPGGMCVFLKNGNVVRFLSEAYFNEPGKTEVEMIDSFDQPKWRISLPVHHTMKADRKQERVYAFTSEVRMHQGKPTKFDVIVSIDMATGAILHKWKLSDRQQEFEREMKQSLPVADSIPYGDRGEAKHEVSHFNSINLVPDSYSKDLEIVVNTGRGLVLFFDRDLHYKGRYWFDHHWSATTHDVQLNEDGSLLVYKNWGLTDKKSSVVIVSMENDKVLWSYSKTPDGKEFQSTKYGSVQFFPDHSFIYTDMDEGGRFTNISPEGKMVNSFFHPLVDPRTKKAKEFHTIRRVCYGELSPDVQKYMDQDRAKIFLAPFFRLMK